MAPSAHAYDLTGTWVGKWSCKGFDGGKFTDSNPSSTLRVTQTANTMAADIDNGEFRYNGGAIPDTAKPEKGDGVLHQCATSNLPLQVTESEIVRITVKTKPGAVKATLKAVSIFDTSDGGPAVGTCKYSYKRTDVANPNVLACPQ
jgi:hypothetical protein